MTDYRQHSLSAAFPAMNSDAFAELCADIAAHGLHSSIVLHEGQVLDGWHRYQACLKTGSEPHFTVFDDDEAAARRFVVSANLMRRHLDTSQRAMIGARLATLAPNRPKSVANKGVKSPTSFSIDEAAHLLNVGDQAIKDCRAVLASGNDDLIAKVDRGEVSASKAAKDTRASKPKAVKPPPEPAFVRSVEIKPQTVSQWMVLSDEEQRAHLTHRNPKASLNRQETGEDDNAIDWAKWTWNPVTGCNHNCPYCYARDIATRFAGGSAYPNGFVPTLRADHLSAPLNGRPRASDDPRERRIFTGSMTDLFGRWVPSQWIEAVLDVARQAQQWEFLMLTKFPKRMAEFDIPNNVWMGTSIDCQARVKAAEAAFEKVSAKVRWISCEPLIEPIHFEHLDRFDLVVIGGASRSSKTPKWIPPYSWLDSLMSQAKSAGCAVFLKSNLYLKEDPLSGSRYQFSDRAPDVFHYLTKTNAPDQSADAA